MNIRMSLCNSIGPSIRVVFMEQGDGPTALWGLKVLDSGFRKLKLDYEVHVGFQVKHIKYEKNCCFSSFSPPPPVLI
ncbi:hypothetical protein OWV82_013205 [Melia azedarach]|uniref:Uncharacterized protein n=1 Tax=Melia azedarach TaxID=155640 RepID=A0ACC1XV34_MELAZ|nr:hypothetical protein OWV82_013205 [Melia azedarach]